jgi:hypothetical protein
MEPTEKKVWSLLDKEVTAATIRRSGLIIKDANIWAGDKLIPGDPNSQNNNGKLFENFLSRNPHLVCVNSLDLCKGLITRVRKIQKGEEKAVLDFFIICDKILPFLKRMIIDEDRLHVLTNFNSVRKGGESH